MKGVKLGLTCKDKNGDVLLAGGNPVPLAFEMKLMQVLSSEKSIYRMVLEGGSAKRKVDFMMTSDDMSELFGYFDDVYYGEPPAAPPSLQTSDIGGKDAGPIAVTISLAPPANQPNGTTIQVFTYEFKLGKTDLSFMLTSTDTSGIFLFMDAMLWSNPPNPPH